MGKTRILNTIFNLGSAIHSKKLVPGIWTVILQLESGLYEWQLEAARHDEKTKIVSESVTKLNGSDKDVLFTRTENSFIFKGEQTPKLSTLESGISLLQEEEEIKPLHTGMGRIVRRRFFENDISRKCMLTGYQFGFLDELSQVESLDELFTKVFENDFNLSGLLYILKKRFSDLYDNIIAQYRAVFPFITDIQLLTVQEIGRIHKVSGHVPVMAIREAGVKKWVRLDELSSGMQKVLLLLVEIYSLPPGSIYMIDEYENSLGVNAINFFPDLLLENSFDIQFIVTSHHPYLLNKLPVDYWHVFHRTGSQVKVLYGDRLKRRVGTSKQQAFIKLLNDSFFLEGRE